ncbi:MAG: sugar phosphate isomerase/epimerase [Candidatus Omnitrophica bacterium]|nr:sugar phosphate isomerase/epimerase [Candidatus Omnitrophota bacterium]MCM8828298.1 sugar phosphate isomerase/epimerase [Candidatus Omnitrophota bacterium]
MKFSIQTIILPNNSLEEIGEIAHKYGYEGIEWRVLPDSCLKDFGPEVKNNLAVCSLKKSVPVIKKINAQFNLHTAGFSSYVEMDQIEDIKIIRDAGCELECPFFRIRGLYYKRDKHYQEIVEDGWRKFERIEKILDGYPIKAAIEIHHGFAVSSCAAAYHFCSRFSPENLGVIHDPGNQVVEGREDAKMGIEILGPYLIHAHFKNLIWEKGSVRKDNTIEWKPKSVPVNEGIIDWKDYIEQLKKAGYNGFLSNEDMDTTRDIEQRLKQIDYLKQFV